MGIVVIGAVFVDIKGFPEDVYVPEGRNAGRIEYIHGGVTRNVVEDIANVELRPTYVSIVDTSALGEDVVRKLKRHKVDTSYVKSVPGGMGTWLAVFDNKGDLAGSISQRPNLYPILYTLEEKGQIVELCPWVDIDKAVHDRIHLLHRDILVVLRGIRTHFQPEQIAGMVYFQAANQDIAVVHGLRAAGQTAVAETVVAVLHQNPLVGTIFRCGICPRALTAFQHNGIIVHFQIAVFDQHIRADINVDGIGTGSRNRMGRRENAAVQVFHMVAAVQMTCPEV